MSILKRTNCENIGACTEWLRAKIGSQETRILCVSMANDLKHYDDTVSHLSNLHLHTQNDKKPHTHE